MERTNRSRADNLGAKSSAGGLDITPAEAKYWWSWFIFGSIMTVETRHHLRRSWGFCARHTWQHAMVEIEAWGGRPFGTAILYEDLCGRAARAVGARLKPAPLRLRRLRPRAVCLACDYLQIAQTVAEPSHLERCARVNRRERTTRLLAELQPLWRERTCPQCLGGKGIVCRMHLLESAGPLGRSLLSQLERLRQRLELFVRSMTWRGPVVGADVQVSWLEVLGWFAGWNFPAALASETASTTSRRS